MYGDIENSIAGYCKYHKMSIDIKYIKKKRCLIKENIGNICPYLIKLPNQYWIIREERKEHKKQIKIIRKNSLVYQF